MHKNVIAYTLKTNEENYIPTEESKEEKQQQNFWGQLNVR